MTVPPVTLLSVWEQSSSSSTSDNAGLPQTPSTPTNLPKAPPSSLYPSRQFCISTTLPIFFFFPCFSCFVSAPLALITLTKSTFLMPLVCMRLCSSIVLPLCGVVCNYSSTVCSAKDSFSPWVKGVPVGAPGPSRRGFGLCGCVIMPIPLVSICVSCCLFGPIWVGSIRLKGERGRVRGGGTAAFHTANSCQYCFSIQVSEVRPGTYLWVFTSPLPTQTPTSLKFKIKL